MRIPKTVDDYLLFIATETARTAWPGSMMRGRKQVLRKHAKEATEDFFTSEFNIRKLWNHPRKTKRAYERWHRKTCRDLAYALRNYRHNNRKCNCIGAKGNNAETIAAKLLDTFMHQLMKTEKFRVLWCNLHLPLDRRVFKALSGSDVEFKEKARIRKILRSRPYSISRKDYETVQNALWDLLARRRSHSEAGCPWTSRIELNWLWI